jgi:hypothetical protein
MLALQLACAVPPARATDEHDYGRDEYAIIRDGLAEKSDDGRLFVEFSAEADGVLMSGDHYRIVDLRVGKFTDSGSW